MFCPRCGKEIQTSRPIVGYSFRNAYCLNCDKVLVIDIQSGKEVYAEDVNVIPNKISVDLPDFAEDTIVYINNKESVLFLEQGIVVGRDHKHCRIKFKSSDPRFNGFLIWIPGHWLRVLPSEFIRGSSI